MNQHLFGGCACTASKDKCDCGLLTWDRACREARQIDRRPAFILTSAGVRIGEMYVKPLPRDIGSEAERIQTALLIETQPSLWARLVRWLRGR